MTRVYPYVISFYGLLNDNHLECECSQLSVFVFIYKQW